MPSFLHRAEALAAWLGFTFLRALSPVSASNAGGTIARAVGPFISASKTADRNLKAVMPELDAAARRRIIAGAWENLGRTVGELAHIGTFRETESGPGYAVTGWEHVDKVKAAGGPCLFFTGHMGNWEILPPAAFDHGTEIAFMYRAASNPIVDAMILRLREEAFGRKVTMFAKGAAGAQAAYRHVAKGGYLGMLIDQKLDNGISAPFFGRPAMTAPALATFALKLNCPVIPVLVRRTAPARLQLEIEPPLTPVITGNRDADILALTTTTNAILERWIRAKPESWLWLHRRWPKDVV
jgi:KDO2-lipid IV(A) lauroyltransferase